MSSQNDRDRSILPSRPSKAESFGSEGALPVLGV